MILLLLLLTASVVIAPVQGFVSPTIPLRSTLTNTVPTTTTSPPTTARRLHMTMMNWEELVFQAESTAASFARQSLEHPTALVQSLPVMYGAGLLTSVSPCVWGLLPLTMSYISTAAGERQDRQATLPTLAFAAGLASVFCTLGIVAATVGGVFGTTDNSWGGLLVALVSSGVCLAMGLQLLELVELPLLDVRLDFQRPASITSNQETTEILLDEKGIIAEPVKQRGSLVRTFLLGGSSALVASPCATPVLTSILAYVASSNDPFLGGLLLLGYTLGYSTPLLLVAATGGQALANLKGKDGLYSKFGPWVTPLTAGVLLWYGTNGMLTALFGDPSLAGLAPIIE